MNMCIPTDIFYFVLLLISEEKKAYTIVELEKRPGVGFGLTVSGKRKLR